MPLKEWRDQETNRDVQKHIGYVLERGDKAVDPQTLKKLRELDAKALGTARIGSPAPDFSLRTVAGKRISLSQFRGKRAVVIVFVYGDT